MMTGSSAVAALGGSMKTVVPHFQQQTSDVICVSSSLFEKSHLSSESILKMTYYWVFKYPEELLMHELKIGRLTGTISPGKFVSPFSSENPSKWGPTEERKDASCKLLLTEVQIH